jgi:hypothetical protein
MVARALPPAEGSLLVFIHRRRGVEHRVQLQPGSRFLAAAAISKGWRQ